MTTQLESTTLDQLTASVQGIADGFNRWSKLGSTIADLHAEGRITDEAFDELHPTIDALCIEVKLSQAYGCRDIHVDSFEVLHCYGGPTIRSTIETNGQVTVIGTWGNDKVMRYANCHPDDLGLYWEGA